MRWGALQLLVILVLIILIASTVLFIRATPAKKGFIEIYFASEPPQRMHAQESYFLSVAVRSTHEQELVEGYRILFLGKEIAYGSIHLYKNETVFINKTITPSDAMIDPLPSHAKVEVELMEVGEAIHFWSELS